MANLSNILNASCSEERRQKNTVKASALAVVSHTRDTFLKAMGDNILSAMHHGDEETQQILADVCRELDSACDRLAYLIGTTSIRGGKD